METWSEWIRKLVPLQNPGFPSTTSDTGSVTWTIDKCQCDVCWLRLDFDTFNILGPVDTVEGTATIPQGDECRDTFTATVPSGTIPTICGLNSGEHIYLGCNSMDIWNFRLKLGLKLGRGLRAHLGMRFLVVG